MKIISLISQKGGSGKTTLSISLATMAENVGYQTVVIDLDPQQSSTKWSDRRSMNAPAVISAQPARLQKVLSIVEENGADLVIIDTAPSSETTALAACRISDLVLVPMRPSIFDIDSVLETINLIELSNAKAFGVLNAVSPHGQNGQHAAEVIEEQGLKIAPVFLHNRVAFVHALTDGHSAFEYEPKGKAAQETKALFAWAADKLFNDTRYKNMDIQKSNNVIL